MTELWKLKCKTDLYNLRKNEAAIESIPNDIALERERMTAIKSACTDSTPVQGGGSSYDDRLNNSICLIDLLTANLHFAEKEVELTRKALDKLADEERRILEVLYIDHQKNGAERLCEELNIKEEATIWKKAMRALESYCTVRYSSATV
jgi:diphthamide synthase (EF-2-diphthine--ammonia ligase)